MAKDATSGHRADVEAQDDAITAGPHPVHSHTVHDEKFEDDTRHLGNLNRTLKSRHIQFLALAGAIGTGLFVGSGQVLSLAGPLSAFISYAVTGFNLFCVINSLGEMAAWLPIPGAVPAFASRYVDEALGWALGWNYWYQFGIG
jgi:amino acid transporter